MAEHNTKALPECFARLENVFPTGPDGLRHPPPECLDCDNKTECLRAALTGDQGITVHEERLNRAYHSGSVGFLERWARQKALERRKTRAGGWLGFWNRFRRPTPSGRSDASKEQR